jgi:hypothetical protein
VEIQASTARTRSPSIFSIVLPIMPGVLPPLDLPPQFNKGPSSPVEALCQDSRDIGGLLYFVRACCFNRLRSGSAFFLNISLMRESISTNFFRCSLIILRIS